MNNTTPLFNEIIKDWMEVQHGTYREITKPSPVPYPEFCQHPDKCAGLGCCPRDPTCAD